MSSSWKLALGAGLAAIAVIGIMAYMSADHEAEEETAPMVADVDGDIQDVGGSSSAADLDDDEPTKKPPPPAKSASPLKASAATSSSSSSSSSSSASASAAAPEPPKPAPAAAAAAPAAAAEAPSSADPAAAPVDGAAAGADDAEEEEEKRLRKERKDEFNQCLSEGTRMLKKSQRLPEGTTHKVVHDYHEKAAACYTRAIELAELLDVRQGEVTTLYNNRAAMYEKTGKMSESLQDCAMVLTMNPGHVKVRKRRARIYQSQGRTTEALVEYCAVLVADTLEVRKKLDPLRGHPAAYAQAQQKIMQDKMEEQQAVQGKLQELMGVCGKKKADAIIAERKGKPGGGVAPPPGGSGIVTESSVFQLLLSYTEFLDLEEAAKLADPLVLKANVLAANSTDDDDDDDAAAGGENRLSAGQQRKVTALRERAMHLMAHRDYTGAAADLMAAYEFVKPIATAAAAAAAKEGGSEGEGGGGGVQDKDLGSLLRWIALFHHVKYDLEGALTVYGQAEALCPGTPEVLVMKSGVYVDMGELEKAEKMIDAAAKLAPDSVDVRMHRCQLTQLSAAPPGSSPKVSPEEDIRACIAARPDHVVALLRLAMMLVSQAQGLAEEARMMAEQLMQQGQQMDASAQAELNGKLEELLTAAAESVDKAERCRPKMGEVCQVRASICEAKGDFEGAMKAYDQSISYDDKNPMPYISKGMLLQQMQQMQMMQQMQGQAMAAPPMDPKAAGEVVMEQFQLAIDADPLCSQAHKMLAEIKLRFATEFEDTQAIVANLETAIGQCRDPSELAELCNFSCIAAAQLEAAKDLGMNSFADLL